MSVPRIELFQMSTLPIVSLVLKTMKPVRATKRWTFRPGPEKRISVRDQLVELSQQHREARITPEESAVRRRVTIDDLENIVGELDDATRLASRKERVCEALHDVVAEIQVSPATREPDDSATKKPARP